MENVIEINRRKTFDLGEARSLLPVIYRMTEEASREVKVLLNRVEAVSDKTHPLALAIENEINYIISKWQAKIEKLGGLPKGLWMADFDNGSGYFCWKFPENEINHWHGYQDGFSGRIVIE